MQLARFGMGLGGMPRKKKDDIDWDNLDGEEISLLSSGAGAASRGLFAKSALVSGVRA